MHDVTPWRRQPKLGRGLLICMVGILIVVAGCSQRSETGVNTLAGSGATSSTLTEPGVSIPTQTPATTPSSPPPTDQPVSMEPGTLALSNPSQNVTFSPGITSTQSYGNGEIVLTPAAKSATPAFSWQTVADMCRTSVGCYELSPVTITVALATGAFNRSPNANVAPTFDNTLGYVISQQVPGLDLSFPGGSTPTSAIAPSGTCTFLNLMNAQTGYFYGGTQFQN